jgi:hypothetical protein
MMHDDMYKLLVEIDKHQRDREVGAFPPFFFEFVCGMVGLRYMPLPGAHSILASILTGCVH